MSLSKRIAFFDDNLHNFHANTFRNLLGNECKESGCILHACHSLDPHSGREWAEAAGIAYVEEIQELRGEIDGVMILAPSNPGIHRPLVEKACTLGVPIFVDKSFALTQCDAEAMFRLADRAGVPLFSSSALRYADELQSPREWNLSGELLQAQAYGGGATFAEYAIHPLEMLISTLGHEVSSFTRWKSAGFEQIVLNFSKDRVGTLFIYPQSQPGYRIAAGRSGEVVHREIKSPIFLNLMTAITSFFHSGKEPVPRAETLKIIELLETFLKSS